MGILRLDHVQVACPRDGEAAAREFYGGLLHMPEVAKPPTLASRGGVWFRAGDQQLHVGIDEPFAPARKAHPAFAVDDLDALAARLRSTGVTVTWDEAVPGQRRFFAADPFGNRLEFVADRPRASNASGRHAEVPLQCGTGCETGNFAPAMWRRICRC